MTPLHLLNPYLQLEWMTRTECHMHASLATAAIVPSKDFVIVEADEERGQKTDRMLAEQARAGLRRDTGGSLETS